MHANADIANADLGVAEANRDLAANQVDVAAATVEKIKALLAYTQIVAPFDGVVARHQVNRGDLVQAATATRTTPSAGSLFTLQRIDTIRAFCDVPENDVPHLHVGDPAIVKPAGFDGKPFVGKVTRFSLRLDPETRNMRTEIDLPNPREQLYPGTYAEVSLEMNRRPDALTVPTAAVGSDDDGKFVYTITDNRITRLAVKTGLTDNGRTEVTAGPSEETLVVATTRGVPPPRTAVQRHAGGRKLLASWHQSGAAAGSLTLSMMHPAIAANAKEPIATATKNPAAPRSSQSARKQGSTCARKQPNAVGHYDQQHASKSLHGGMQRQSPKP